MRLQAVLRQRRQLTAVRRAESDWQALVDLQESRDAAGSHAGSELMGCLCRQRLPGKSKATSDFLEADWKDIHERQRSMRRSSSIPTGCSHRARKNLCRLSVFQALHAFLRSAVTALRCASCAPWR